MVLLFATYRIGFFALSDTSFGINLSFSGNQTTPTLNGYNIILVSGRQADTYFAGLCKIFSVKFRGLIIALSETWNQVLNVDTSTLKCPLTIKKIKNNRQK